MQSWLQDVDAKLDASFLWKIGIPLSHAALYIDRTLNRSYHTRELH